MLTYIVIRAPKTDAENYGLFVLLDQFDPDNDRIKVEYPGEVPGLVGFRISYLTDTEREILRRAAVDDCYGRAANW